LKSQTSEVKSEKTAGNGAPRKAPVYRGSGSPYNWRPTSTGGPR
jgi:hypothetical protein